MDYESKSMWEGISEDLGGTVGVEVSWFEWGEAYFEDHYLDVIDDVYDTSSGVVEKGRRWAKPFKLPVVMAQIIRSSNVMNERGFYVTDTLRLVVNVGEIQRLVPGMLKDPSSHIKDRIIYRGEVFVPTRVLPRGSFGYNYAVVTIDCNQVNSEELVNDPQFQSYAQPSVRDNRQKFSILSGLSVNGTAVPAFSTNTLSYNFTIPANSTSASIIPTALDETNTVIMYGLDRIQSGATFSVGTPSSITPVSLVVTSGDGEVTKTYALTLTKAT